MAMVDGLPEPAFFDSGNATRWAYEPDAVALFAEAGLHREQHGILPSGSDQTRIHLLLIDLQRDFCFPEGTLYVGGRSGQGAVLDSARVARFIYRNLGALTEITSTLDTHLPQQIFFPSFWLDGEGNPPAAHREITSAEIRRGELRPNPAVASWLCHGDVAWLRRQVEFYCDELERGGRYRLYLWPPHCLLGGDGHNLVGVIQEARLFHSFVRGARDGIEVKGSDPLTENYSVFAPESLLSFDGRALAARNDRLVETLLGSDRVIVAGQAASHCVRSSIDDLLVEILRRDERLAGRVYILEDCMSSVTVPDASRPGEFLVDFTREAEDALRRFAAAGMHVVRSSEPMEGWPAMRP